jgi:hypothetical protein
MRHRIAVVGGRARKHIQPERKTELGRIGWQGMLVARYIRIIEAILFSEEGLASILRSSPSRRYLRYLARWGAKE